MTLLLTASDRDAIRVHLESAYPGEGCGLLIGRDHPGGRRVDAIAPLSNASGARGRRYVIAPEAFLEAEKAARVRGLEVVGVFHSHPDHSAEPSADDRAHAWPFLSYLIGSVRAGRLAELRAFRFAGGGGAFAPEPVNVVDAAEPDR